MTKIELREEFEQFKLDLAKVIQEQVALKVKEEIKNEIIVHIIKEVRDGNTNLAKEIREGKESITKEVRDGSTKVVDTIQKGNANIVSEVSTGFYQTHHLLANIAGILNKIEAKL